MRIISTLVVLAATLSGASAFGLCVNGEYQMQIDTEQAIRVAESVANNSGVNTLSEATETYLGPQFCQAVIQRDYDSKGLRVKIMTFRRTSGVIVDSVSQVMPGPSIQANVACNCGKNGEPVTNEKVYGLNMARTNNGAYVQIATGRGDNPQPEITVNDGKKTLSCRANYLLN